MRALRAGENSRVGSFERGFLSAFLPKVLVEVVEDFAPACNPLRVIPGRGADTLDQRSDTRDFGSSELAVHEGDKCTLEVLLDRCGLKDAAPRAISEIIHDVDLKDRKFGRTEVAGIRTLVEGIGAATRDDTQRIARGSEVFNDLYEYFRKKRR